MFVSHADAQSSDDCVNWLDAINEYEEFRDPFVSELFTSVYAGMPAQISSSLLNGEIFFPTSSDPGYTILVPTKDAAIAFLSDVNEKLSYEGLDLDVLNLFEEIIAYHTLVENEFAPQFGLGGNTYRLE